MNSALTHFLLVFMLIIQIALISSKYRMPTDLGSVACKLHGDDLMLVFYHNVHFVLVLGYSILFQLDLSVVIKIPDVFV